ncbi:hypothetical protein GCM10018952_33710 [Streptosporangium vulgare]
MKAVSNVVDGTGTVNVGHDRVVPVMPVVEYQGGPYRHVPDATLLTPWSLEMERTLVGPRLDLARAYARENGLNRVTADPRDAWLGVVASGTAYHDVREGFRKLGVTPEEAGVRLLRIGMLWPLDPEIVRTFARGLSEILVVEEKAPLLETSVKDILYGTADAPRVLGKLDENGARAHPPARGRRRRPGRQGDRLPAAPPGPDRSGRIERPERPRRAGGEGTLRHLPPGAAHAAHPQAHPRSSARAARTTVPPPSPTARPSAPGSAATPWWCSTARARARSPA